MTNFLHTLNDLSGAFLLLIAFGVGSCAASLSGLKKEIECLHEDFDTVHNAHEIQHQEMMGDHGI